MLNSLDVNIKRCG